MYDQETIDKANQTDVKELVAQRVELTRESAREWSGPCPKCGGDDRLHTTHEWWFCRDCHGQRGDAIEWLQWVEGIEFPDAVERLTGEQASESNLPKVKSATKSAIPPTQSDDWQAEAQVSLQSAQEALWRDESPGAVYLHSRGLERRTWRSYGLGYGYTMNRDVKEERPAIAMPWYRSGKLTAIRWRFIDPPGKQKISSHRGSRFGGLLFGGQALPDWLALPQDKGRRNSESWHTLVICEGEINAMSIWQVAGHTGLHVLSLGSETGHVSDAILGLIRRYRRSLVWMDKLELAKSIVRQTENADAFESPGGRDANDLLQSGELGGVLTRLRLRMCRDAEERDLLRWGLYDAMTIGPELDDGTMEVYRKEWGNG